MFHILVANYLQQTAGDPSIWIYVALIVGAVSRTVVPFLARLTDETLPEESKKFDKKYLVSLAVAVLITIITTPLLFGQLASGATYVTAWMLGWAAGDMTRELIKFGAPRMGFDKIV